MPYQLWDAASGNVVGEYGHLQAALNVVRRTLGRSGMGTVEPIELVYEAGDGRTRSIASGQCLVRLAQVNVVAAFPPSGPKKVKFVNSAGGHVRIDMIRCLRHATRQTRPFGPSRARTRA